MPAAPDGRAPAAPDTAIVVCQGLRRCYGPVAAVDNLDLEVHRGELLAVLGPSGCGKTTLLRLVAGFERPDAGSITVEAALVAGPGTFVPPERRRVGIVVQDHALFPHLTVAGNVAYGLPRGAGQQDRVDEVLATVGLDGLGARYPAELSGGQQQRVAIARALAPGPGVVLLDEPFANLDAALRARIRFEVRAILKAAGATAILVTHDQEEALSLADRVAVVDQGRVVQVGPPDEVYRRPASAFVARFVGDADLLPGTSDGTTVTTPLGRHLVDGPAPPAGPALAVIRPESVRLSVDDAGGSGPPGRETGSPATVALVTYYGHDQLVEVALEAGTILRARLGAERLFSAGERVRAELLGPVIAYTGKGLPPV